MHGENLRGSVKYLVIFAPIFVLFGPSMDDPTIIADFVLMAILMLIIYRREIKFKSTAISLVLAVILFLWLFAAIYYALPSIIGQNIKSMEIAGGLERWFVNYKENFEALNALLLYPISFSMRLQAYNGYYANPFVFIVWAAFVAIVVFASLYYLKKERYKSLAYGVFVYALFVGLMLSPHILWNVYLWIMHKFSPLLIFRMTFDKFYYGAQLGFTIMLAFVLVKIIPKIKKFDLEELRSNIKEIFPYATLFVVSLAIFLGAYPAINGVAMKYSTKESKAYYKADISNFDDLQRIIKNLYLEDPSATFLYVPSAGLDWIDTTWYNGTDYAYYLSGATLASGWYNHPFAAKIFSLLSSEDFIFNETKQKDLLELFKIANIKYVTIRSDVDFERSSFNKLNIGIEHQIPNILFFMDKYGFEKVSRVGNEELAYAISLPFDDSFAKFDLGDNFSLENFTISVTFRRNVNSWVQVNVLGKEDSAKGIIADIGNLLIADFGNGHYGIVLYNSSGMLPLVVKGPYDTNWHKIKITKNDSNIKIFLDNELLLSKNIGELSVNFTKVILGLAENIDLAKSIGLDFSFNGYISDFRIYSDEQLIFDLWEYYNNTELHKARRVMADPIKPQKFWLIFRSSYNTGIAYGFGEDNSLMSLEFKKKNPATIYIFPNNASYSRIIVARSYDPWWSMEVYTTNKGKSEVKGSLRSYLGLLEIRLDSANREEINYVIIKYIPHLVILRLLIFPVLVYSCLASYFIISKVKRLKLIS